MNGRLALSVALLALAAPAMAHTGHGTSGFVSGLVHPLLGLDHLLAMIAVGLWSALAAPRLTWLAPAGFFTGLLLGGFVGFGGFAPPGGEALILGSVVLFGALAFFRIELAPALAFSVAGIFGAPHGLAHGAELPEGLNSGGYMVGFLITTAVLLSIGALGGTLVARIGLQRLGQAVGACVVVAGAILIAS